MVLTTNFQSPASSDSSSSRLGLTVNVVSYSLTLPLTTSPDTLKPSDVRSLPAASLI